MTFVYVFVRIYVASVMLKQLKLKVHCQSILLECSLSLVSAYVSCHFFVLSSQQRVGRVAD